MFKSGCIAAIIAGTLLTGCVAKNSVTGYPSNGVRRASNDLRGDVDMVQCEKELRALESINHIQHVDLKSRFERVMSGASGYTNVRSSVNPETRNAIDALYKFQAVKLCSEVRAEMLNSLAVKPTGENI